MRTMHLNKLAIVLFIAAFALIMPQLAQAAGTAANTTISNTATVSYMVSGVTQSAVSGSTSFKVDIKVNQTVKNITGSNIVAGQTGTTAVLVFTVTNNGNATQNYALSPVATSGNTMNNIRFYKDNNNNGLVDGGDTLYADATTFGSLASDATYTVLLVADAPATGWTQTNGSTAPYALVAQTTNAGTTTVTTQPGGAAGSGTAVVFADAAGTSDALHDGQHSATGTYTVSTATIAVTKTSVVYSDPINGTSSPKAIPGAVLTYTVQVSNTGAQPATSVTISDNLNTEITAGHIAFNTAFLDGSNNCGAGLGIVVNTVCKTNTNDGDGADFNLTGADTVTVSGLTIPAGNSATIKYQVVIQ